MENHFLFGAGASFGSGFLKSNLGDDNIALGGNLYATLLRHNLVPHQIKIDEEVKNSFEKDFEEGMAILRHKFEGYQSEIFHRFLNNLALYLLGFSIENQDKNLYCQFINLIIKEKIESAIMTTNYDLLIEEAIERTGKCKFSYFTNDNIPLLKIHGSTNFLSQVVMELRQHGIDYFGLGVKGCGTMAGPIYAADKKTSSDYCSANVVHPSMAMYEKGKEVVVCPATIIDIQERWRNLLKVARNVFVIGMRVVEEDSHIWLPLAESKANIFWYGKNQSDIDSFSAWKKSSGRSNITHINGYFDEFIRTFPKLCSKVQL